MRLTRPGAIVQSVWLRTAEVDHHVSLDAYVVMPDHVHGILVLEELDGGCTGRRNLSSIVGTFKAAASREIREEFLDVGPIWQRGYHDRIIRSDRELAHVRRYIEMNPARWIADHPPTP